MKFMTKGISQNMKKKISSKISKAKDPDEPSWLYDDPDKKPVEYSDKDLEVFADGFFRSNRDIPAVKEMIKELGLKEAKKGNTISWTRIKTKHKL